MLKENKDHPLPVFHDGDKTYGCIIINQDEWWVETLEFHKESCTQGSTRSETFVSNHWVLLPLVPRKQVKNAECSGLAPKFPCNVLSGRYYWNARHCLYISPHSLQELL